MLDGWARQFGDALDIQTGTGVAAAPNGDVLVTGSFGGQMQMDGVSLSASGTRSVFVARLTSSGDVVWAKGFAGASLFDDQAVAVDANGNVLLVGGFFGSIDFGGGPLASAGNEDMYLAKLDANGNHLWSKRFGDGGPQPRYAVRVGADAAGNVLLATSYTGTVDLGGGPLAASGGGPDLLVAKLDANGNHLWSKRFGDAEAQFGEGWALAVTAAGDIVVGGDFDGKLDLGGGLLVSGSIADAFLARFTGDGAHVWSKAFKAGTYALPRAVAVDKDGGVFFTGYFTGSLDLGGGTMQAPGVGKDVFLGKFTAAGAHVWSTRFGDTADQYAYGLAADATGNAYVAGSFAEIGRAHV